VTVTVGENNRTVTVTVEDSGRGFDVNEVQQRLRTGAGFGLFSIRERMSYMKGSVDIVSEPGRGTCVRLAVPVDGKGKGVS
jgi:signal transduction histidine kinase